MPPPLEGVGGGPIYEIRILTSQKEGASQHLLLIYCSNELIVF